jgi:hypothetical protein
LSKLPIETIHKTAPAYPLIEKLGGKSAVAAHLDVNKSTLSRWCQPRPFGTGGVIPQRYWPKLIAMAQQQGRRITMQELTAIKV